MSASSHTSGWLAAVRGQLARAFAISAIGVLAAHPLNVTASAASPQDSTSANYPQNQNGESNRPNFSPERLEQMLAPIALYPDSLLTQVLMASTYPLEVVQADRWARANRDAQGDEGALLLENENWDPSVKSLVNFPDVLAMLSDRLEWTESLGDAFLGQQQDVMDTVQRLRARAHEAGNLTSTSHEVVDYGPDGNIVIVEASPNLIYVPSYDPFLVYGTWPYPSFPPYRYWPHGFHGYVGGPTISWEFGVPFGFAWGYAWGRFDWGHHSVHLDIHQNFNFNSHIHHSKYIQQFEKNNHGGWHGNSGVWNHDVSHRRGIPYRDDATAKQYGSLSRDQAVRARQDYRGRFGGSGSVPRTPASPSDRGSTGGSGSGSARGSGGRQQGGTARPPSSPSSPNEKSGAGNPRGNPTVPRSDFRGDSGGNTGGASTRPTPSPGRSTPSPGRTPTSRGGTRGGVFDGVHNGGSTTRGNSNRGQSSRGSSGSRGSGGGGSRSGGGRSGGGRP